MGSLYSRGGTPIHYLYGYVRPIGVVILKLLIQNGVSISQAFSRTGYNISNARKLQFCKQPFEIIQGQIAFKNTVQCVNKQTVVLLLHPRTEYKEVAHFQNGVSVLGLILERGIKYWPISRKGYQFQGKFFLGRGVNLESRRHIPTQNGFTFQIKFNLGRTVARKACFEKSARDSPEEALWDILRNLKEWHERH